MYNDSYMDLLLFTSWPGYNGDLICLQEVDRRIFYEDLQPILSSHDLHGAYTEKNSSVAEGMACFFRMSKFRYMWFSFTASDAYLFQKLWFHG